MGTMVLLTLLNVLNQSLSLLLLLMAGIYTAISFFDF